MSEQKFNTLESFIATIDSIDEGERNDQLYRIGRKLRRNVGLHGADLLLYLHEVNSAKCSPPLEDDKVAPIAGSVDRSNVPIGSLRRSVDEYLATEISSFASIAGMKMMPPSHLTICRQKSRMPK